MYKRASARALSRELERARVTRRADESRGARERVKLSRRSVLCLSASLSRQSQRVGVVSTVKHCAVPPRQQYTRKTKYGVCDFFFVPRPSIFIDRARV